LGTENSKNAVGPRKRYYAEALFLFLPLLVFAIFYQRISNETVVTTDSPTYLYFAAERPVGYPLFLAFIHLVFKNYAAAVPIQLALLCSSCGFLAWAFYIYTGKLSRGLVLEALLFLNPGLFLLTGQIMTESLSATCIAFFVAALLLTAVRPRARTLCTLIAIACIAITLRPINLVLVAAAFMSIVIYGKDKRAPRTEFICLLLAGLFAAQELSPFTHWLRNEPHTTASPLARGLLQKTLFRQWPQNAEANVCEGALIAKDTKAADDYLAQTPSDIRPYLLVAFSSYLRFNVLIPQLVIKYKFKSFSDPDKILMCYALARIKSDPLYFINGAAEQFWYLLTYSTFVSSYMHDRIETYIENHPISLPPPEAREDIEYGLRAQTIEEMQLNPLVFGDPKIDLKAPIARSQLLADGIRLFQMTAALLMLVGIVVLPWVKLKKEVRNPWPILGIMGIAFFGELLVTAIVEFAFPRYVYPLWPLVCTAFVLALSYALDYMNPVNKDG